MSDEKIPGAAPRAQVLIPDVADPLGFAEALQRRLIVAYLHDGSMPMDVKEQALLIKLLGDMSKQELTKRRLDIEDKGANANQEMAKAMASFATTLAGKNPFENPDAVPDATKVPKFDSSSVDEFEILDSEMDLTPKR